MIRRTSIAASYLLVALVASGLGYVAATQRPNHAPPSSLEAESSASPVETFSEIARLEDPAERAVRLVEFFRATDPSFAPQIRDRVLEKEADRLLPIDEITEILLADWWAESDPEAAFHGVVDPRWGNRHPWIRVTAEQWARRDPAAAAGGVLSLPANPSRGRAEGARVVIDEWIESAAPEADPTPLLALLNQLDSMPRALAIQRMLGRMIEAQGVDSAEQFVRDLQMREGDLGAGVRSEFVSRMGVTLLEHDLDRARVWAETHGKGPQGAGVLKHLAAYWAYRDGPAAMKWAMNLDDDSVRPMIIKRAWLSFGRSSPEQAQAWITAREPTETLRGIYSRFLRSLAAEDPARALALAKTASDPAVRESMLESVGRGWIRSDPTAAVAWLAKAGLSSESEARIRASAPTPSS